MLDGRYSIKFKKDFKTCQKRNYNMRLLQNAIDILRIPAPLPVKSIDYSWNFFDLKNQRNTAPTLPQFGGSFFLSCNRIFFERKFYKNSVCKERYSMYKYKAREVNAIVDIMESYTEFVMRY